MRLTRVAIDGDAVVDLHPRLTVVRGLGPDARQRLVDAFIGLPDGSTRGVTGWVELDGTRRDLGAVVFEELAAADDTKLVVRGRRPARERPGAAPRLLAAGRPRLRAGSSARAARVGPRHGCGRRPRSAGAPCASGRSCTAGSPRWERTAMWCSSRRRGPRTSSPTEVTDRPARRHPDPHRRDRPRPAPARPGGARHGAGRVEAATSPAAAVDDDAVDDEEGADEPVEPEGRADEPADPFSSTGEDLFVGNPFAEAQPAEPEPADGDLAATPFEEDPDPVVVAGRLRVAEARRTLAARQAAQRTARNRSELIEALEAAHTEVVEAHHRDRFGRSRSKVDEARHTEQQLLEQLGFPSYTAFVLSAGAIRSGDEAEALAEARSGPRGGGGRARAHRGRARRDAGPRAMQRRATRRPGGTEIPDNSAELRVALAEVGLVLEDATTDGPTLVALAHSWLERAGVGARAARRAAGRAGRARGAARRAAGPERGRGAALRGGRARPGRGRPARRRGRGQRHHHPARGDRRGHQGTRRPRRRTAEQEPADVEEQAAMSVEQRVDDVTWYLTTRLADLRPVGDGLTCPILLDDPFVDFECRRRDLPAGVGRAVRRRGADRARSPTSRHCSSGPRRSAPTGRGWWAPACRPEERACSGSPNVRANRPPRRCSACHHRGHDP